MVDQVLAEETMMSKRTPLCWTRRARRPHALASAGDTAPALG
ncbi:hypothetical protein Thivi_1433 [Thiocystis violascens DSM 198]|uniref:Uncharacterized protein n=1 Tax=Thiocystis violascens (strain ATCC 17096 / DSM 198 / 6111) TaxID=765911 RepID=I3Y8X1_THIV6|nr:hypothetical protein Thivi_1433 [Thiocystis violascens DSM 198]